MRFHRIRHRREILPFAVASCDQYNRLPQSFNRRQRRADIRSFGIVVKIHAIHVLNPLHAVRLAHIIAQTVQQFRQRQINRAAQCQRGQGIHRIVTTANAQGIGWHQALHANRCDDFRLTAFFLLNAALIRHCHTEPFHRRRAVVAFAPQTILTHGSRHAHAKTQHARIWLGHRIHGGIITVEHLHGVRTENLRFGLRVFHHIDMPIQMILRQIQHCRRIWVKADGIALRKLQLEAGQLQHPHLRQRILLQCTTQRIQHRRTDIARRQHAHTCRLTQMAGQ